MRLFTILLAVAVVFCATHVHADSVDEEAKKLFEEGAVFFDQKDFNGAAQAFRESYRLKPAWRILFNLAQSEAAAKRYGLAINAFEKYLAEGGDEIDKIRQKEVVEELDLLRAKVGAVEILAREGTVIVIDDVERGTAPLGVSLRVAAAVEHRLVVRDGEKVLLSFSFSVNGGDSIIIDTAGMVSRVGNEPATARDDSDEVDAEPVAKVILQPDRPIAKPMETYVVNPSAQKAGKIKRLKITGLVLAATGGALLLGGTAAGIVALNINDDLSEKCEADDLCRSNNEDRLNEQMLYAHMSTVMIATGAAAATAGAILLIRSIHQTEQLTKPLTLTPVIGIGFSGVVLRSNF